ncbi:MAG: ATP-binding protein [Pedosphaera sp.]|nr:ATP-binding protein [Pedosphaera sp.]
MLVLPVLFRVLPIWVCVPLALAAGFVFVPELRRFDFAAVTAGGWAMVGGSVLGVLALYFLGGKLAAAAARAAATALGEARKLYDASAAKSQATHQQHLADARLAFTSTTQMSNNQWKQIQAEARTLRKDWAARLEDQARKLRGATDDREYRRQTQLDTDHSGRLGRIKAESAARLKTIQTAHAENLGKLETARDAARQQLDAEWQSAVLPVFGQLKAARAAAEKYFAPWRTELWRQFDLPDEFVRAARFAELQVDLEKLCGVTLPDFGLRGQAQRDPALPSIAIDESKAPSPLRSAGAVQNNFALPLLVAVPDAASILFETKNSGHEQIIGALNSLILRLLTSAPPGKVAFTIFDPVGLGQNFAGIMHLADFEERVINSRIWTQAAQFEQRLGELNDHIEKVTQMYLRNEYASLAEYNAQAGRLAEKYQFLVIADFPVNFSDVAVKRLQNIIASGPRCGVHTLIHWDQRRQPPLELVPDELRKNSFVLVPHGDGFAVAKTNWDGVMLALDAPPAADLATELLQKIGKASTDSYRVEMPFAEVVPAENEMWSLDTTRELRIPIGRTGATKLQYLALGQGTRQHGLVAGKTGSGKSTLFHVIVTNLALWCSPDQVEFYLVDFKKGVEFKCYATHKLPHARVIAIESDREFGLSVLQRVDDELKRRGDLFRKLGAQDIASYKRLAEEDCRRRREESSSGVSQQKTTPHVVAYNEPEPMPRVLLLIDEFQELFVEDDRVSQTGALLLDRIVRQGRAFGIHVLLGSQTLGGAYTLARATIGQMVVRVALQCNEADAYLIMSEDNPAPRLLSRPGEAIYNDDGGAIQGNSPFQIVWLPDQVRDEWLDKASAFAAGKNVSREPIVFEGNAPANIRDNPVLRSLLNAEKLTPTTSPRVWLGAPNSIKGPTEAIFQRQSGNHLLIAGQREEAALAMLVAAQIALAAQHAKGAARIFVFDCSAPDSAAARSLERVAQIIPGDVRIVGAGETQEVISELAVELDRRNENPGGNAPTNFLLVHGLQQNKKLRFDEEASFSLDPGTSGSNPGLLFNKLICEGASQGFHVIATCDTYNNVMRMISRKALSEFEMRVVFQMSANDSASLIESPAANNLGLHRAILHNGQQGWMETFRPYALPDDAWLGEAGEKITRLRT